MFEWELINVSDTLIFSNKSVGPVFFLIDLFVIDVFWCVEPHVYSKMGTEWCVKHIELVVNTFIQAK